jgi:hypothetical protein
MGGWSVCEVWADRQAEGEVWADRWAEGWTSGGSIGFEFARVGEREDKGRV